MPTPNQHKQHYDKICNNCGGLVARPNTAYGYSGLFCQCDEPDTQELKVTVSGTAQHKHLSEEQQQFLMMYHDAENGLIVFSEDYQEFEEGFAKLLAQARKEGAREGIRKFADWVWAGWNLDLRNKERSIKHFEALKDK